MSTGTERGRREAGRVRARQRRWDLSAEEQARVLAARQGALNIRLAARLLLRSPELVPEVVRIVCDSAWTSILANNSLISLLDAARARTAVPDAATGVGWYDERPFLDELTPHLRGDVRALELGAGAGRISRHVAPLVADLVCTDQSRAMVAEARENLSSFANVRVATTNGYTLSEFSDESFDVAFGQGVLGYLNPNRLLGLLDELRRVLVPGGVCVFNFLTIDNPLDAQEHLATVRRLARRRQIHGALDCAYTRQYLDVLYGVAGLRTSPVEATENGAQPARGRMVVTAWASK